MRLALPLIYCVPDDVKAKLLGRITDLDSVPELWWKDWPAIEFKPIPVSDRDKEFIQAHTDAINFFMRQAPSRSRG